VTFPVIDAHHHLWPPDPALVPWLDAPLHAAGSPAAHAALFGDAFTATVWIEAVSPDPEAELRAAETVRQQTGGRLCTALVAHAPLDAPDIEARLDRLMSISPALTGIRDIISPGPHARAPDLLARPAFARGLAALARRGLSFDLMLRPAQMQDAAALLGSIPTLRVAINHAGAPHDTSPTGLALWTDGLTALAAHPGTIVKVSALHCLFATPDDTALAGILTPLRTIFGAHRLAFGTDWPVHDRHCPGPQAVATLARLTASWPDTERRALFHDTAARFYRLG
jgi:L-fuconolactonase